VAVLVAASATVRAATQWTTVSAKADGADIVLTLKDSGDGHPRLEWSPMRQGVVLLMTVKAQGPIQDGKIQIEQMTKASAIDSDTPVTLAYLKDTVKLKRGYYAVRIHDKTLASNWIVIEIK
jgi:hypothetical protein